MARLYSDEQFPRLVSELLRTIGHDVLTVQEAGNDNLGISDEEVLAFAISDNRAVVTLNRQDFIRLHRANSKHFGIIVCTNDTDRPRMATRIDEAIALSARRKSRVTTRVTLKNPYITTRNLFSGLS